MTAVDAAQASVTVRVVDGVAAVEIANPGRHNALTRAMCLALTDLMPRLDADPTVRMVTLRGSGRSFSAGAGIGEVVEVVLDEQPDGARLDHLSRADEAIGAVAKPTVALVDGPCIGGAWQIASACDVVLASERSTFAVTPAKIGFLYPRRGLERLVHRVGAANAKYLLLTGDVLPARRAAELGLVTEVVADDRFEERTRGLTDALLARSRFSVHTLKRLVDLTDRSDPGLDEAWAAAWRATLQGPDLTIGVEAFLSHRPPRFTWSPT